MKKIDNIVKGKNVIIVGPSSNVLNDCKNIDVDSYDIVVRLNSHYKEYTNDDIKILGKRIDILYHYLGDESIDKEKDFKFWDDNNIKVVSR